MSEMTFDEMIERIKVHNEIHSKKETQAVLITKALNKAIDLLENLRWHYPSEMDFPEENKPVLVCTKEGKRYVAIRFLLKGEGELAESFGGVYLWKTVPHNSYEGIAHDWDVAAWCSLPNFDEKGKNK